MRNSILIILSLFVLSACDNMLEDVDFNVALSSENVYKVGEKIRFNIAGNPDYITFYSGEQGYNYDNIQRSVANDSALKVYLSFVAKVESRPANNSLKVLLSDSFQGIKGENFDEDSLAIVNGNWLDKTSECNLPTAQNGSTTVNLDITDFINKNTCVAFKYEAQSSALSGQPQWTISGLKLILVYSNGNETVGLKAVVMGFSSFDMLNRNDNPYLSSTLQGRWNVSSPQVSFVMNYTQAGGTKNLDYAISSPLIINSTVPDIGIGIGDLRERVTYYEYEYQKAGTYNVAFVGKNANVNGEKSLVRKINLTITE